MCNCYQAWKPKSERVLMFVCGETQKWDLSSFMLDYGCEHWNGMNILRSRDWWKFYGRLSVFVDYLTLSQKWSGELDYQFQPY